MLTSISRHGSVDLIASSRAWATHATIEFISHDKHGQRFEVTYFGEPNMAARYKAAAKAFNEAISQPDADPLAAPLSVAAE